MKTTKKRKKLVTLKSLTTKVKADLIFRFLSMNNLINNVDNKLLKKDWVLVYADKDWVDKLDAKLRGYIDGFSDDYPEKFNLQDLNKSLVYTKQCIMFQYEVFLDCKKHNVSYERYRTASVKTQSELANAIRLAGASQKLDQLNRDTGHGQWGQIRGATKFPRSVVSCITARRKSLESFIRMRKNPNEHRDQGVIPADYREYGDQEFKYLPDAEIVKI